MLYEYDCKKCGHNYERLLPVNKRDEGVCPKCGASNTHKIATGTHSVWVGPPDWAYAWKQGKVF